MVADLESLRRCSLKIMLWAMTGKYPSHYYMEDSGEGVFYLNSTGFQKLTDSKSLSTGPVKYFTEILSECVEGLVDEMSGSKLPSLANALNSDKSNMAFPLARAVDGEDAKSVLDIARAFDRVVKKTVKQNEELLDLLEINLLVMRQSNAIDMCILIEDINPSITECLTKALSPLFSDRE